MLIKKSIVLFESAFFFHTMKMHFFFNKRVVEV